MTTHFDAAFRAFSEAGDRQLMKLYVKKAAAPVETPKPEEDGLSEEDAELLRQTLGED